MDLLSWRVGCCFPSFALCFRQQRWLTAFLEPLFQKTVLVSPADHCRGRDLCHMGMSRDLYAPLFSGPSNRCPRSLSSVSSVMMGPASSQVTPFPIYFLAVIRV